MLRKSSYRDRQSSQFSQACLKPEPTKFYREQHGIGSAKYTVSFHDGETTHDDGSPFYDIAIFKSKKATADFVKQLKQRGFKNG
jgi:hypothetical protein